MGIALTSFDYMWRSTPMHRTEVLEPSCAEHMPPPYPDGVDAGEVQGVMDGAGPLFHRRYSTRIRESRLGPEELFAHLTENLNRAAPITFARFQRVLAVKRTL